MLTSFSKKVIKAMHELRKLSNSNGFKLNTYPFTKSDIDQVLKKLSVDVNFFKKQTAKLTSKNEQFYKFNIPESILDSELKRRRLIRIEKSFKLKTLILSAVISFIFGVTSGLFLTTFKNTYFPPLENKNIKLECVNGNTNNG